METQVSREEDFRADRRELDKEFRGQRKPMKRGRIKPVNKARKAKRFQENYGGREYMEFVHGLPCAVCDALCEFTEAAHVKSRGAGGKADSIVPLCGNRFGVEGCHSKFDRHLPELRKHEPRLRTMAKRLHATFIQRQQQDEETAA